MASNASPSSPTPDSESDIDEYFVLNSGSDYDDVDVWEASSIEEDDDEVDEEEDDEVDEEEEEEEEEEEMETTDEAEGIMDRRSDCTVCSEPWHSDGPHRSCCIPCGHLYGRSCLEKWLEKCTTSTGKCPQCKRKFKQKDIINLYAPLVVIANDDLEKELCSLREANKSLELEKIAKQANEYTCLREIVADLQLRSSHHHQKIQMLMGQLASLDDNQQGELPSRPSGRTLQPTTDVNGPIPHDATIDQIIGIQSGNSIGVGHGAEPRLRDSNDSAEDAVRSAEHAEITVVELWRKIKALRALQDAHSIEIEYLWSQQQDMQEANISRIQELKSQFQSLQEKALTLFSRLPPSQWAMVQPLFSSLPCSY